MDDVHQMMSYLVLCVIWYDLHLVAQQMLISLAQLRFDAEANRKTYCIKVNKSNVQSKD